MRVSALPLRRYLSVCLSISLFRRDVSGDAAGARDTGERERERARERERERIERARQICTREFDLMDRLGIRHKTRPLRRR